MERQDDLPYPAAIVEFLTEQEEEPDPEVVEETRGLYAELVERAQARARSNGKVRFG